MGLDILVLAVRLLRTDMCAYDVSVIGEGCGTEDVVRGP
jgi:hypothetical protein